MKTITTTRPNVAKLIADTPARRLLTEGTDRDDYLFNVHESFLKGLDDRANAPLKLEPVFWHLRFGLN
jgi:hypothetical protein